MTVDIHPEAEQILAIISEGVPRSALSIDSGRQYIHDALKDEDPEPVNEVQEFSISNPNGPSIPLRMYIPEGEGPFPVLVNAHGGGFRFGDLDITDPMCRALTNEANCMIVSVDYRLAPENRFPAGLLDYYTATKWTMKHAENVGGDPDRIVVGGSSAGGNLAAATCQLIRNRGEQLPAAQLLVYPGLISPRIDYEYGYDMEAEPFVSEEGFLTEADMVSHWEYYVDSDVDDYNPYASPLLANDVSGLPPAKLVTCGLDPTTYETRAYGDELEAAGVSVSRTHYDGMVHAFINMIIVDEFEKPREAIVDISNYLSNV